MNDSKCGGFWLVFGGAATHPFRRVAAETLLRGKVIDEESARAARGLALDLVWIHLERPRIADLARTLARRALLALAS